MALVGKRRALFSNLMDMPPLPPPLPASPKKNRTRIIVVAVVAFCAVFLVAAVVAGFAAFQRVKDRAEATRAIEKTTFEERQKMADLIESGATTGGEAALGRMKDQLEKSAGSMTGGDAKTMQAMATVMGKIQAQVKEYETVLARVTEAEIFSFKLREKGTFADQRQLIGEFLATNKQLTETLKNGGDMMRAELDHAGVPARIRDATVSGFQNSQLKIRPLQMRIRGADQILGDSALAIFDLLEKNRSQWKPDKSSGAPVFKDDKTLEAYNELIEKIQAAAADQTNAQSELVRLMRAK